MKFAIWKYVWRFQVTLSSATRVCWKFFCMNEWACLWQKSETSWILQKSSLYLVVKERISLGILAPSILGLMDFPSSPWTIVEFSGFYLVVSRLVPLFWVECQFVADWGTTWPVAPLSSSISFEELPDQRLLGLQHQLASVNCKSHNKCSFKGSLLRCNSNLVWVGKCISLEDHYHPGARLFKNCLPSKALQPPRARLTVGDLPVQQVKKENP